MLHYIHNVDTCARGLESKSRPSSTTDEPKGLSICDLAPKRKVIGATKSGKGAFALRSSPRLPRTQTQHAPKIVGTRHAGICRRRLQPWRAEHDDAQVRIVRERSKMARRGSWKDSTTTSLRWGILRYVETASAYYLDTDATSPTRFRRSEAFPGAFVVLSRGF